MRVRIVVATDERGVYAVDGRMPWNLPREAVHFRSAVQDDAVAMGLRTFLAMGYGRSPAASALWVPLPPPERAIVVCRRPPAALYGAHHAATVREALDIAERLGAPTASLLGGRGIVAEGLALGRVEVIWHTVVHANLTGPGALTMHFDEMLPEGARLVVESVGNTTPADAHAEYAWTPRVLRVQWSR